MWTRRRSYWAAIVLCASQLTLPIWAQAQGAMPAGGGDKPIDIQANEQEFAGDTVIARGNVKVIYKDTIITGPQATLVRTSDGQAKTAIFKGHPHMINGTNRMDADMLQFEVGTGQIIADGHSHSEVSAKGDDDQKDDAKQDDSKKKSTAKTGEPGSDVSDNSKDGGTESDTTAVASAAGAAKAKKKKQEKSTKATAPEMIVTDADHQEYSKEGGKFEAQGHVHLTTGDIVVHSDKMQLMYGTDNKPEAALFNGNVNATQFDNNTLADNMTYFLTTQRMQATGHVRSKVIQKNDPKKGGPANFKATSLSQDPVALGDAPDDQVIDMTSDAQDYSKDTGRISAQGNVHVKCGDITGFGPNVVVTRRDDGSADKILFTGRSQINQPGRKWIGDRITITVLDHRVLAAGNTRAIITSMGNKSGGAPSPSSSGSDGHSESVSSKISVSHSSESSQ
jgi:lipopolysaccharide export system protein LptA